MRGSGVTTTLSSSEQQYGGPARNWALPLLGILVDSFLGWLIVPEIVLLIVGIRRHKRREGSYGWNMALIVVSGLSLVGYVLLYGVLVMGGLALSSASHTATPAAASLSSYPAHPTAPAQGTTPAQPATNGQGCPAESGDVGGSDFVKQILPVVMHQRELAFTTGNTQYLNCFYKYQANGYQEDVQQINGGFRYQSLVVDTQFPIKVISCVPQETCTVEAYVTPNDNPNRDNRGRFTFEWVPAKSLWLATEIQHIE